MEAKTSDISITHPHAAYVALIHDVISSLAKLSPFMVCCTHSWCYQQMECIPSVCDLLLPLEEIICTRFLPNLSASDVD